MGKSKKRSRASKNRLNPLNASGNGNTDKNSRKDANLIAKKIQPLIKQLQSAVPNDRNIALSSVSVFCEDPHMRQLLLKEKLVQIVMSHLLNDNNLDIVIESVGLLRNLTLEEGYDLAIHLWRSEIWTHIKNGMAQLVKSLDSLKEKDTNDKEGKHSKRLLFDYADNLISLIVALSNGSDEILDQILEDEKLHEILYTFVKFTEFGFDKLPTNLQNTLLDLIYDFSSESLDFIDSVMACEPIAMLLHSMEKLDTKNELTKILTQGIRLQFLDGVIDEKITSSNCTDIVNNVIHSIKDINLEEMKKSLYNNIIDSSENFTPEDTKKLKSYAKAKQDAMMQLQAIEVGIDVITGIMEIIASSEIKPDEQLTQNIVEVIPQLLFALLKEFPARILITWNNLLWLYVTLGHSAEAELLTKLWNEITATSTTQDDMATKIGKMSVVWVILKLCGSLGYIDLLKQWSVWGNPQFITSIKNEYINNDDIEFRQKCCGVLTTISSYQGQSIEINKLASEFLLENMASSQTNAELLVDMTHSIFEIYGDGDFDYDEPIFVGNGYLNILKDKVQPNLKNAFKMVDKNKSPELKERCTACYNTLDSFIHYKTNERA